MLRTEIILKPQLLTHEILKTLEIRGLISQLSPTDLISSNPDYDAVDTMYTSEPESGAHKLICVRKNQTDIRLTVHSENEEVIFLNQTDTVFKPLYLIISLLRYNELNQKLLAGELTADDVMALEVNFNDPYTSVFTILKDTPHCEITIPGTDPAPIFYVTESAEIAMQTIDTGPISFHLQS